MTDVISAGDRPGGATQAVVVIGEALVDVVRGPGGVSTHAGGSPANVAIGLARLGLDVELLTQFGTDTYGEFLAHHLTANGVQVRGSGAARPTSVAQANIDRTGAASYEFDLSWDLDAAAASDALVASRPMCIHTGSIAAVLDPGARTVLDLVQRWRGSATISYDPNCRPSLMGDPATARQRVELFVGVSDVVKASDQDIAWLYPGDALQDVAERWLEGGVALVVITCGELGHLAVTRSGIIEGPRPASSVRDTVGAGDSFMSAMLAGLARLGMLGAARRGDLNAMTSDDATAVLHEASAAAALTCSRTGADPPTRAELNRYLAALTRPA
jgi:fructokinase